MTGARLSNASTANSGMRRNETSPPEWRSD